jgi:drug/metabolite transporter (DMT)-like permease
MTDAIPPDATTPEPHDWRPERFMVIAAAAGRGTSGAVTWGGSLIALLGVALVAGGGGSGSTPAGDLLVLLSVAGSAAFIVVQPRLLHGRDAGAVTALQLGGGALLALPVALLFGSTPGAPSGGGVVVAVLALVTAGTLASYWLFAWAQARVPAELASAFVNLEPLVGALAGVIAFHEAFGTTQVLGGFAILAAIALSAAEPEPRERRPRRSLRHVFAD